MLVKKVQNIFEDGQLLVLGKPPGMVVNESETSKGNTLQSYLLTKLEKELKKANQNSDFFKRSGLVHRLDKETSGVILVAKDQETFEDLQAQFKNREVIKEYVALVLGEVLEEKIEVNAPIARNPNKRTKMAVVSDGREAQTSFEKIKVLNLNNQKMTLLKAFPKTGRTHQVRVHLTALNHPVVGDDLYAGRKRSIITRSKFKRLMLHAHKVTIKHLGKSMTFESKLPAELSF